MSGNEMLLMIIVLAIVLTGAAFLLIRKFRIKDSSTLDRAFKRKLYIFDVIMIHSCLLGVFMTMADDWLERIISLLVLVISGFLILLKSKE